MRSRITLILFSPRFSNLHLFSFVVLIGLTLGIGHKKHKGNLSNNQWKISYSCIYIFLNSFHQKFLAGILNLGSRAVFCENMREVGKTEGWSVEKWRFLIKSRRNVLQRYNGLGPNLKEEHLCSISNTLDFSQEVCEHTQFEGEVEYVDSSQVGCVADNLSF